MKLAKQFAVIAVLCLAMWGVGGFVPQGWIANAQDGGPENQTVDGLIQTVETPQPILDGPIEAESQTTELIAPFAQTDTGQWPQVQNDSQHTGYYPGTLGTNFSVVWRRAFQPEKVHPQVQAIIFGGRVFVGTESGNLYALNAASGGNPLWVFAAGGPILNSVAAGDNRVYFASMDGAVYAVNATTGAQIWKKQLSTRLGFSTAPVLAGGKVMLGGRNGVFYALNPVNGDIIWQYKAGGPILMTAAANGGNVYFTSMDMHVYARDIATGAQGWVSPKVPAMAFKDYYPLVYGGYVYVRPWNKGDLGVEDRTKVTDYNTQMAVLNAYQANPNSRPVTMFRFNEQTGALGTPVIHYWYQTMNGGAAPPCIDRDGLMIMSAPYTYGPEGGPSEGWGRVNPSTRVMVDLFVDGNKGLGAGDETMATTCTGNLIFAVHFEEQNVQFTGAFNLDTRKWTQIGLGKANSEMFTNTQAGGTNAVSIANNLIYHISVYELIVRSAN